MPWSYAVDAPQLSRLFSASQAVPNAQYDGNDGAAVTFVPDTAIDVFAAVNGPLFSL